MKNNKDNTLFNTILVGILLLMGGIYSSVSLFMAIKDNIKDSIKPLVQYQGTEDITINEQTLKGIALTEKKKTFTKEGIPHIQFGINIIQRQDSNDKSPSFDNNTYILTQKEFDAIIGEENDAFDYEEYNICYSVIIQQDSKLGNAVDKFAAKHNLKNMGPFTTSLRCNDYLAVEEVEDAVVRYDESDSALTLYLDIKPRVNFFGDTGFTEEEKGKHKEMIDNMCRDILRMINKEESQLTWE